MKKKLTVLTLKGLRPAPAGKRVDVWDTQVENFGVRVTDKGAATFVVMRRIDGTLRRWTVGEFRLGDRLDDKQLGEVLAQAREKARDLLMDIRNGVDPTRKAEAVKREREIKRANTFSAVVDDYIAEHLPALRTRKEVEAVVRRLVVRWGERPIVEITRADIADLVRQTAKTRPTAARNLFAKISALFGWAVAQERYGLAISPTIGMKAAKLGARVTMRDRVLSDAEIRLFWRATGETGAPFGPLFRFLLLTGQRRDEAAEMVWSEIDQAKALWTVPAARAKMGTTHTVPLCAEALAVLAALPRPAERDKAGDFVFTTTTGARPVSGFSKAKSRLDAKMLELAREDARESGGSPDTVTFVPWRLHDLRRTARTHFSQIPTLDLVRELAIGHVQQGVRKVYDLHKYDDEKRALMEAWGRRLMAIVDPKPEPENVVKFPVAASA